MKAKQIQKLLIANRGEIALRIHRSASEMGIQTVAIFSDVDRCAPYVLNANEAYPLHGNLSKETYLNIDKIIDVAKKAHSVMPSILAMVSSPKTQISLKPRFQME